MAALTVKHPQSRAVIVRAAGEISSSVLAREKDNVALEPDRTR
jgi:hypothetical protein